MRSWCRTDLRSIQVSLGGGLSQRMYFPMWLVLRAETEGQDQRAEARVHPCKATLRPTANARVNGQWAHGRAGAARPGTGNRSNEGRESVPPRPCCPFLDRGYRCGLAVWRGAGCWCGVGVCVGVVLAAAIGNWSTGSLAQLPLPRFPCPSPHVASSSFLLLSHTNSLSLTCGRASESAYLPTSTSLFFLTRQSPPHPVRLLLSVPTNPELPGSSLLIVQQALGI